MKININEKAMNYIKERNIENIVVDIDMDSKAACCGAGTVDFRVFPNAKDRVKNYKKELIDNIEIYYSPNLEFYFKDESPLDISSFGISKFQKLYVTNEINFMKD